MSQSFRNFGSYGAMFDVLAANFDDLTQLHWQNRRQVPAISPLPDESEVFAEQVKLLDRSSVWLNSIVALTQFGLPREDLSELWSRLAPAVVSEPESFEVIMAPDRAGWRTNHQNLFQIHSIARYSQSGSAMLKVTDPFCFGPFSNGQLEYLKRHHPRLFDWGGGSGYLVSTLIEHGIDARGYDSNDYRQRSSAEAAKIEPFPWTEGLVATGRYSITAPLVIDPDETLGMFWPAPGSGFPGTVLKAFRESGGRRFLFKLGGYVGVRENTSANKKLSLTNIMGFLAELGAHWLPAAVKPPFDPSMFFNNLYAFECR